MPRKKQLTPKDVPKQERPTQGNSKGRPRVNPTRWDMYFTSILTALLARTAYSDNDMEVVLEEAKKWADYMIDQEDKQ